MTHFSVLVLTDTKPTPDVLARIMAPYKEFDGEDATFVRDVDITEKTRADHREFTQRKLVSPDGAYHDVSEERFYRAAEPEELSLIEKDSRGLMLPNISKGGRSEGIVWERREWSDGSGTSVRVLEVPDGWKLVEVPFSEFMPFDAFVEYWHSFSKLSMGEEPDYEDAHSSGYYVVGDEGTKVYRRYNPQGYWDWYEVGGRFNGDLRVFLNDEAVEAEDHWTGEAPEDGFNIAQRRNLDLQRMKLLAVKQRREALDALAERAQMSHQELETALRVHAQALERWLELPEPRPVGDDRDRWLSENFEQWELAARVEKAAFSVPRLPHGKSLEDYVNDAVPISAHAIIKDGVWMQRGKAGMFASMSDVTMSGPEWTEFCLKLVEDLPKEHWITVVDCHV